MFPDAQEAEFVRVTCSALQDRNQRWFRDVTPRCALCPGWPRVARLQVLECSFVCVLFVCVLGSNGGSLLCATWFMDTGAILGASVLGRPKFWKQRSFPDKEDEGDGLGMSR